MKKGWAVLLCLGLIYGLSTTIEATADDKAGGSTEITTQVPESHVIMVEQKNAEVFVNGEMAKKIVAERLSTPEILIRAESGYRIDKVTIDGNDITAKVVGGYYTFAPVHDNQVLKIKTKKIAFDDNVLYTLKARVTRNAVAANGIKMELRSVVQTKITDYEGNVTFDGVEVGLHSLTAIENNKIVGYVEFTLRPDQNEKEITVRQKATGDYEVIINSEYDNMELMFDLNEDGRILIKAVHANKKQTDSLKTGDDIVFMPLAVGLAIAGLMIKLIKKKES